MEPRIVASDTLNLNDGRWYYLREKNPFTGIVLDHYPNGVKKYELEYKNGLQNGTETKWYDNGDKQYEVPWVDGKKHGHESGWLEANRSQKSHEIGWKHGKYHGAYVAFNHDGTVRYQCTHIDGKRTNSD